MLRYGNRYAHLLLLAMTVSSCTCGSETPAPPPATMPTKAAAAPAAAPVKPTATAAPVAAKPSPPVEVASPTPGELALPADFPADITVMEGSEVAAVQKLGGGAQNVLFSTDADPPKIFDYYKEDLKQKGHEITQQYQTGEQSFLSFKKGGLVTNVIIAKDPHNPKKRVVAIMYYEEQPAEDF